MMTSDEGEGQARRQPDGQFEGDGAHVVEQVVAASCGQMEDITARNPFVVPTDEELIKVRGPMQRPGW
eukprot:scaffold704_cov347-Prasinococcus_capsulatus_cf.AAC.19